MPPRSFHAWPRLATELKVLVLERVLRGDVNSLRTTPLHHRWFMQRPPLWAHSWLVGRINSIIATRNREIVDLALDVYYRQVKKTYFEEPVEKPVTSVKPTYHSWLDSSYRIYRHEDYQERQWTYLRKHVLRRTKTPQPSTKEFCYYPRCTARNLDSEPTFHPWSRLPTELKILILEHALRESIGRLRRSPQYHQSFVLRAWATFINCNVHVLGAILGTRNHELVELVLDACESQARQCQQPAYLRSAYYSQVRMTYLENPLVLIALAKGQGYDRADLRWWNTLRALTARRLGNPHTSTAEPQV